MEQIPGQSENNDKRMLKYDDLNEEQKEYVDSLVDTLVSYNGNDILTFLSAITNKYDEKYKRLNSLPEIKVEEYPEEYREIFGQILCNEDPKKDKRNRKQVDILKLVSKKLKELSKNYDDAKKGGLKSKEAVDEIIKMYVACIEIEKQGMEFYAENSRITYDYVKEIELYLVALEIAQNKIEEEITLLDDEMSSIDTLFIGNELEDKKLIMIQMYQTLFEIHEYQYANIITCLAKTRTLKLSIGKKESMIGPLRIQYNNVLSDATNNVRLGEAIKTGRAIKTGLSRLITANASASKENLTALSTETLDSFLSKEALVATFDGAVQLIKDQIVFSKKLCDLNREGNANEIAEKFQKELTSAITSNKEALGSGTNAYVPRLVGPTK